MVPSRSKICTKSLILFQALCCRTKTTFPGAPAKRPDQSFRKKVLQFPIMYWGSKGCNLGLSQIIATCVRQVLLLLRLAGWVGSGSGGPLFLQLNTVPLPVPWKRHTLVSSMFIRNKDLSAGTLLAKWLNHCHAATACETETHPESRPFLRPACRHTHRAQQRGPL